MDEIQPANEGNVSGSEQTVDNTAPVGTTQDGSIDTNTGMSEETTPPQTPEDNLEVIDGGDGKKYIPMDAFEKRLASEVSKRKTLESVVEGIKNDPMLRQQFLDTMNEGKDVATPSQPTPQEPTLYDQFLGALPTPEAKNYTSGLVRAIAPQFEQFVQTEIAAAIKQHVTPLMAAYGETALQSFYQKNPTASKYEGKIANIMRSKPGTTVEDAYKLAAFDDIVKGVRTTGAKEEQKRQQTFKRTPVTGPKTGGVGTGTNGKASIDDAIDRAMLRTGFGS